MDEQQPTLDELYKAIQACDKRQGEIHQQRRELGLEEAALIATRETARAALKGFEQAEKGQG